MSGERSQTATPLRHVDYLLLATPLAITELHAHGGARLAADEINASGGNAAACHAQMYTMGTILRHGSDEQKQSLLPRIAAGELRLQAPDDVAGARVAPRRPDRSHRSFRLPAGDESDLVRSRAVMKTWS